MTVPVYALNVGERLIKSSLFEPKLLSYNPGDKTFSEVLCRNQFANTLEGFRSASRILGSFHCVIIGCPNVYTGDLVAIALHKPPQCRNTGLDGKLWLGFSHITDGPGEGFRITWGAIGQFNRFII